MLTRQYPDPWEGQRRDTERLGNGRHNEYVTILINLIHLLALHETGEMETVGNAPVSYTHLDVYKRQANWKQSST